MGNSHPWPRHGLTIDFMQHVRADAGRVWKALTTEAEMQHWLGLTYGAMPLSEGEPFALLWVTQGRASGETTHGNTGRVHKVTPERLLALEWQLRFADGTTQLSVQLQPSFIEYGYDRGPECDIWIIHSGFPSEGRGLFEYDGTLRHWRQSVENLVAWLEDRPAKPTDYGVAGLEFVGGAPDEGVLVSDVAIDAPAHQAGIRPGDLIRSIDGQQLHSMDDFHAWAVARSPGDSGTFELAGRGSVTVTLESVETALQRLRIRRGDSWDRPDAIIHQEAST